MKNVYYTLGVVCLLLVFGCKKDKEEARAQVVGRWKIESIIYKVFIDDKEQTGAGSTTVGTEADFVEFTADGKVNVQLEGDNESVTYTLDETNRTVTIDGQPYSIIELTKTKLVLKASETETYGNKTARGESTLNLKK